jgi:hypothetical protein
MRTAAVAPEAATSHSGSDQGSGRYTVRSTLRPPSRIPTADSPRPTSSIGIPMTVGAVLSSRPYIPTPAPSSPVRVSAAVARRVVGDCSTRRPYPRESIAEASASDRSRVS